MEEKRATIPYFEHEGEMARAERNNRRLFVALVVAVTAVVLTLGALLANHHMWMEYVKTIETQQIAG